MLLLLDKVSFLRRMTNHKCAMLMPEGISRRLSALFVHLYCQLHPSFSCTVSCVYRWFLIQLNMHQLAQSNDLVSSGRVSYKLLISAGGPTEAPIQEATRRVAKKSKRGFQSAACTFITRKIRATFTTSRGLLNTSARRNKLGIIDSLAKLAIGLEIKPGRTRWVHRTRKQYL